MRAGYIDNSLVHNSSLACFLLTSFVQKYEALTAGTASPELMKMLLVLPVLWHKESCLAVRGRQFATPLHAVLADAPVITLQFEERMGALVAMTCQGINLACATGLLRREYIDGKPYVELGFDKWPKGSNPSRAPAEMRQATDRLATWFRESSTASLYRQFLKE